MTYNMATMLAEDTGAYELRNPLTGGMRKHAGWTRRLFGRKPTMTEPSEARQGGEPHDRSGKNEGRDGILL